MVLSDGEILDALQGEGLVVDPLPAINRIKPSSIDLRLHPRLLPHREEPVKGMLLDPAELDIMDHLESYGDPWDMSASGPFQMGPDSFVIGQTLERIEIPLTLAARVEGKSSIARLGLAIHLTAPKIDPGFKGHISLEMYNFGPYTLRLSQGMDICVLILERLGRAAKQGYAGRFQDE